MSTTRPLSEILPPEMKELRVRPLFTLLLDVAPARARVVGPIGVVAEVAPRCTTTSFVNTPGGSNATICVSLQLLTVASLPPSQTLLLP